MGVYETEPESLLGPDDCPMTCKECVRVNVRISEKRFFFPSQVFMTTFLQALGLFCCVRALTRPCNDCILPWKGKVCHNSFKKKFILHFETQGTYLSILMHEEYIGGLEFRISLNIFKEAAAESAVSGKTGS